MILYLIIAILCGSSYILTTIIIRYALKKSILDVPNERSSHSSPTPTGGGLAIVITWYIGVFILYLFNQIDDKLLFSLLPGLLIAIISMIDDVVEIKPIIRLLTQATSLVLALYFMNGFSHIDIAGFTLNSKLLSILFFIGALWFINVFNFLDGINGYASFEAIFVALAMFILVNNNIFLVLIVSVLGFLFFNWPNAKVFMGDIGSTQLGYILVILGLYFHNEGTFDIFSWAILTSLFWVDATITLYRRFRNREILSKAHKKHAYQRIVQAGFSHKKTVITSLFLNTIIFGLVIIGHYNTNIIPFMLTLDVVFLYLIIRKVDHINPFV